MNPNHAAAAMYDNEGTVKLAEAELFAKLAASNNIDLTALEDEEVIALYNHTFNKVAEEDEEKKDDEAKKDDEDEEEKKEAAAREHQTKLAYALEQQQADDLGVRMAQSYVRELNKVGAALQAQAAGAEVEAEAIDKEAAMPAGLAKALGKVKDVGEKGVKALSKGPGEGAGPSIGKARLFGRKAVGAAQEGGKAAVEFGKKHKTTIGVGAGAASLGAGAGYAAGRKKESSAIDQLALECAVKIAHADGQFDLDEVAERVSAVHVLGLEESSKLASTVEQQVEVRALEYLEAAGYPVVWE